MFLKIVKRILVTWHIILSEHRILQTQKFDCSQGFKLTDEPREAVAEKEEHPTTNDRLYNLCVTNSILTSLSSPGSD